MQDTWVWSLGWEDPLEEGKATYSSILAWEIPWTEEPGGLQTIGGKTVEPQLSNMLLLHNNNILLLLIPIHAS